MQNADAECEWKQNNDLFCSLHSAFCIDPGRRLQFPAVPCTSSCPRPRIRPSASGWLPTDGKKEVKVVLWTYMGLDPREEFIQADRHLAGMLAEEIRRLSEENKEKVTVVKPNLVEQYKSRHPNWQALDPEKVGHDFNADYVINLEIDKLSLYEPNANQQLYRGQTQILVSVVDMKHPDERDSTKSSPTAIPPRPAAT